MSLRALSFDCHRIDMQTRFPFHYGIASLTELPHLFVHASFDMDGERCTGVAADGLPPKWFTKDASTSFEDDDLPAMLRVIRHAIDTAVQIGPQPSVFAWWRELYNSQMAWANANQIPPLLAGFGASLLERTAIDAFCRRHEATFHHALFQNAFQVDLQTIHNDHGEFRVQDIVPRQPIRSVRLRHTVGLSDPVLRSDIAESDSLQDGLPHALVDCIEAYGLTHFKIKLGGDPRRDLERLTELSQVLPNSVGNTLRFTLDGNEQFQEIESFRQSWQSFVSVPSVRDMIDHGLLFVEQPLHRDHALDPAVRQGLDNWSDAPPIIIDESDARLDSFSRAIAIGYSGTSHKNCKGVFKSVLAAATVARQGEQGRELILSAEDLVNVGPVALLQDLAVVGALGIGHVERNGHHYLAGLSLFPVEIQEAVVSQHGDVYQMNDRGFAQLTPLDGKLSLQSVNNSPFGVRQVPDFSLIEPWRF